MAATTRRARNYKEKNSGVTFGHFALPVASIIALCLLFVGIKLFFMSPSRHAGIPVPTVNETAGHSAPQPVAKEPDFALADGYALIDEFETIEPEKLETADVAIVLAGPLSQRGTSASSSGAKTSGTDTKRMAAQTPAARTSKPIAAGPQQPQVKYDAAKWGVQIGAFVNESSASTLVSDAKKNGYAAFISKSDNSGKTYHRVRIGAGATKEEAGRLAAELEKKGYPVSVVPIL